jgi:hypothetical protein
MLHAYLNYPNAYIRIHEDGDCRQLYDAPHTKGRRIVSVSAQADIDSLDRPGLFAAKAELNDMWLRVDLGSASADRLAVARVRNVLGGRYTRFAKAPIHTHCGRPHS